MGRPAKLTPEVQRRIVQLIRAGNTIDVSCEAAGIERETYSGWMRRGLEGGSTNRPHREFRAAAQQAQAEAEAILVTRIAKAATNGSWTAAAWLLERRAPTRWAKQSERANGLRGEQEQPADDWEVIYGANVTPIKRAG